MKNNYIFLFCLFFGFLFSGPVSLSDAEKAALNLVIKRDNNGQIESLKNILIDEDGNIRSNGGRVLAITGISNSLAEAANMSYLTMENITLEGSHFRKDIGHRAL